MDREASLGLALVGYIMVAIADVDVIVRRDSAIDSHAADNTTSVYTPAAIFPMLPERLSTDLTSLNADEDRLSIVMEFAVLADGSLGASDVYGARVRNYSKLAYNSVDAWLTGEGPLPAAAASVKGMDELLTQRNVKHVWNESGGGHSWPNWQVYL